ncbi:hypothetical protein V2H45_24045 [Tumidithrix elongata RA019]|uniref:Secreted protein n=1 Tax=Tumidithrix elongata BACA0141 TaxID=2716417 RepID=A0AAW9Q9X9_9CYAN|nr:hypothetical protein [Tumidithrix elongata RA019]
MLHFTKYFALGAILLLATPIAPSFADKSEPKPTAPATETPIQGDRQIDCKAQQVAAQAIDLAGTMVTPGEVAKAIVQTAKGLQDVNVPEMSFLDTKQTQMLNSALSLAKLMTRNLDAEALKPTIASLYRNVRETAKKNAQCSGQ